MILRLSYIRYKYRHYSPEMGRFMSRDPIEEKGGTNVYEFVRNQPTHFVDRLGMVPGLPYKTRKEALRASALWNWAVTTKTLAKGYEALEKVTGHSRKDWKGLSRSPNDWDPKFRAFYESLKSKNPVLNGKPLDGSAPGDYLQIFLKRKQEVTDGEYYHDVYFYLGRETGSVIYCKDGYYYYNFFEGRALTSYETDQYDFVGLIQADLIKEQIAKVKALGNVKVLGLMHSHVVDRIHYGSTGNWRSRFGVGDVGTLSGDITKREQGGGDIGWANRNKPYFIAAVDDDLSMHGWFPELITEAKPDGEVVVNKDYSVERMSAFQMYKEFFKP